MSANAKLPDKGRSSPPPLALRLLARMSEKGESFSILGDLAEEYARREAEDGPRRARRWCWGQVLESTPAHIGGYFIGRWQMLKNVLKIAVRNFLKHKGYSLINLFGLAVGLASCILIYLWTQDALSYNRFHKNAGSLYRIYSELTLSDGYKSVGAETSYTALARFVMAHCPEALAAGRLSGFSQARLQYQGQPVTGQPAYIDPAILRMLSFDFVKGSAETALPDKYSCFLTDEAARRIFGGDDPIGKKLTLRDADIRVTGVVKSFPRQSDYRADVFLHFGIFWGPEWTDPDDDRGWGGNPLETYVQLRPGARPASLERSLNDAYARFRPIVPGIKTRLALQPLTRVHIENPEGGGLIQFVPLFALVALFILIIACANFINLTTARSGNRAREVGLRKVVGARRGDLIRQFFTESLIMAFVALALALGLTALLLPAFGKLVGNPVSWDISLNGAALANLAAVVLLVGLVAGGYPAVVLSSFRPLKVLKAAAAVRVRGAAFRKGLVVLQFSISIILIVVTIGIGRQLRHMKSMDLGFEREDVMSLVLAGKRADAFDAFKAEVLRLAGVRSVTRTAEHPAIVTSSVFNADWEGKNPNDRFALNFMYVDYDFFEAFQMKMAAGRTFSKEFPADLKEGYIINEAAAKLMGMADPVGQKLSIFRKPGTIVGVVKDFNFQPLNFAVRPLVVGMDPAWTKRNVFIRFAPGDRSAAIRAIEGVWKTLFPDAPFGYTFFNDRYRSFYPMEMRLEKVIGVFSTLAVLVSCLGLLGLASFMAEQRTKEIGIRKVLGASTAALAALLSKEFVQWVAAAVFVAWPLAYLGLRAWLGGYAYRISLGPSMFLAAGGAALLVALLTVSFQAIKAARKDPVQTIRYE